MTFLSPMPCSRCGRLVPQELANTFTENKLPGFCSGTCFRIHFQQTILDLLRASLTPQQYDELTTQPGTNLPITIGELKTTAEIRDAIRQVTDALLTDQVKPKQASLVLYALQTALGALRTAAVLEVPPDAPDNPPHTAIGFTAEHQQQEDQIPCRQPSPPSQPKPSTLKNSPCSSASSAAPKGATGKPPTSAKPRPASAPGHSPKSGKPSTGKSGASH